MPHFLDTAAWPRREAFEYFRGFDKPYFNVCTRLDAAPLKAALVGGGGPGGFSLACNFIALRLANLCEPFRYRLEGGRVRVHEVVHGSTTVLRADDSFSFAYLEHQAEWAAFAAEAAPRVAAVKRGEVAFAPRLDESALVHLTTLPWVHFTSFSHARNWHKEGGREDSVPKVAFGRAERDGARLWLPVSVEVHHALMDGLHVGRYLERFEGALRDPAAWGFVPR